MCLRVRVRVCVRVIYLFAVECITLPNTGLDPNECSNTQANRSEMFLDSNTKERRFLKFRFSNHKASSLLLRKHPEPVVATAIMAVDKF